jgi:integrase
VVDAIRPADAPAAGRLFPKVTPGQVSVAFRRAVNNAKIEDFSFHDLRHSAASWLRMSGADIHTVAQLLGHKDLRMAARYQHLSPAFLSEAVKGLDRAFAVLLPCQDTASLCDGVPTASPAVSPGLAIGL